MPKTMMTPKLGHPWGKLRALSTAIEAAATREPYPRLAQFMRGPSMNNAAVSA